MLSTKRIETADGSHSLWIPGLDETYHSRHGAIQESEHVFIANGLARFKENPSHVKVLEVGFGTGLNALLAFRYGRENRMKVSYTTIEKYPLSQHEWQSLNYGSMLDDSTVFNALHEAAWNKQIALSEGFSLRKIKMDLDAVKLSASFDIVFYDAFGPRVQPNMWTVEKLSCATRNLSPGGILATYCAQGQFRRNLTALGMRWEALPGPPGKREMTMAQKET